MRIRLDLAYDGAGFHGWATQPGLRTVQGDVEAALATALRLPAVALVCAGRTDTGVHARGQVTHLDVADEVLATAQGRSTAPWPAALLRRVNGVLADDVRVRRVSEAPEAFDARFSATWRRYAYRVADEPGAVDPLTRGHVLAWRRPLDVAAMNAAAAPLLGLQDFAAYCKRREGASTTRTLRELSAVRRSDGVIETRVVADAFCHNMVRSLMGALLVVGEGRREPGWAAEVLAGRRRVPDVPVVAPHGLCLEEVGYPDDAEGFAAQAVRARGRRDA